MTRSQGPARPPVTAAAGTFVAAAEIALAPVSLGCTVLMIAMGRLTRWPTSWLALPAVLGIGWALVADPGRAAAGFAQTGAHVVAFLIAPGSVPAHLAQLPAVLASWRSGLAGQFPLAVTAAAAQAALLTTAGDRRAGRASGASVRGVRPDRDHAADPSVRLGTEAASEPRPAQPGRTGLLRAARRWYVTATLRRGEVATTDGACLAVDRMTGRRIGLSWADAAGGIVLTGLDDGAVSRTGLDLVHAAIQHRKAVIIVDLGCDPAPIETAVAAACAASRAPSQTWGGGEADGPAELAGVLARRQVLLAQPGARDGGAPAGGTRMIISELSHVLSERRALGVPADGVIWISSCERAGGEAVARLAADVRGSGIVLAVGTASGPVAAWLADHASAVAVRGRPPADWPDPPSVEEPARACDAAPPAEASNLQAGPLARQAGPPDQDLPELDRKRGAARLAWPRSAQGQPARTPPAQPPTVQPPTGWPPYGQSPAGRPLPAGLLGGRADDDLSLLVRGSRSRLYTGGRAVR